MAVVLAWHLELDASRISHRLRLAPGPGHASDMSSRGGSCGKGVGRGDVVVGSVPCSCPVHDRPAGEDIYKRNVLPSSSRLAGPIAAFAPDMYFEAGLVEARLPMGRSVEKRLFPLSSMLGVVRWINA